MVASGEKIKVRVLSREQMLEERQAKLREYELRYEMSSEEMAALLELDSMRPTGEVIRWYQTYCAVKSLLETTPTTGTPGTTNEQSTKAG